jgi:hypothetical protein
LIKLTIISEFICSEELNDSSIPAVKRTKVQPFLNAILCGENVNEPVDDARLTASAYRPRDRNRTQLNADEQTLILLGRQNEILIVSVFRNGQRSTTSWSNVLWLGAVDVIFVVNVLK